MALAEGVVAALTVAVAVAVGVSVVPRPPRLEGERWFKTMLAAAAPSAAGWLAWHPAVQRVPASELDLALDVLDHREDRIVALDRMIHPSVTPGLGKIALPLRLLEFRVEVGQLLAEAIQFLLARRPLHVSDLVTRFISSSVRTSR